MATYTDAVGTDMDMAYSMPTMMVGAVVDEPGMVTLLERVLTDRLTMAPIQVGETITRCLWCDYFRPAKRSKLGQMWQWYQDHGRHGQLDLDITGATSTTPTW